ncbi:hypothetical protein [Sulfitobacter aestuariivivens]|uniref:Uncharacterized protein n=1 Tax=Sulfitobacter aestuariivivens TaxID=2766981 RepID=A0A927D596_9RHOB|nr:hypothetical protein [Sulfitobacter aestuariivivens]MBD3665388.1 hypothetical protein [Sulfitobacter aestuariivivens]
MLGLSVGLQPQYSSRVPVDFPTGFGWDQAHHPLSIHRTGTRYVADINPRDLVDPAIWAGPAYHVDSAAGDDGQTGLGSVDGDFTQAKRTIYAAFLAGNATAAPYRVLVKPGTYEESAFTRNGNDEPDQPVAIIGWGGPATYRTGPFNVAWTNADDTFSAPVSSVKRVFRTDVLTPEGHYTELTEVTDTATCAVTDQSWAVDGSTVHINIGSAPGANDIALLRSFHGARFMTHTHDIYLENIHTQGGITGALHLDPVASRNIVGLNCSFRYAAPSNPAAPLDAARIRRTSGLCAFFNCDASQGAKDGWSFHEDGVSGLHVLLQDCTGWRNGIAGASSCNGFTTHDAVRAIVLNGAFGLSRNGTEVHVIQSTQSWLAGTTALARDVDGTSIAFKCSNPSTMWLQDCRADAAGSATNYALEVNAGTVLTRDFAIIAGSVETSLGGTVASF